MNVASLELCKELYELSGWGDCKFIFLTDTSLWLKDLPHEVPMLASAYDLGYLLRKLPEQTHLYKHIEDKIVNAYSAWTLLNSKSVVEPQLADTPENALCQLAIELFKQGILTNHKGRVDNE